MLFFFLSFLIFVKIYDILCVLAWFQLLFSSIYSQLISWQSIRWTQQSISWYFPNLCEKKMFKAKFEHKKKFKPKLTMKRFSGAMEFKFLSSFSNLFPSLCIVLFHSCYFFLSRFASYHAFGWLVGCIRCCLFLLFLLSLVCLHEYARPINWKIGSSLPINDLSGEHTVRTQYNNIKCYGRNLKKKFKRESEGEREKKRFRKHNIKVIVRKVVIYFVFGFTVSWLYAIYIFLSHFPQFFFSCYCYLLFKWKNVWHKRRFDYCQIACIIHFIL